MERSDAEAETATLRVFADNEHLEFGYAKFTQEQLQSLDSVIFCIRT